MRSPLYINQSLARGPQARDFSHGLVDEERICENMQNTFDQIDELAVNTVRTLSIEAIQKANSGHPGLPMGAAPMAYALWANHLKVNPKNSLWADRDRFILSAGHGSAMLYSLLQ